jgi:glycosyltransferase involved in cell wall biosynthesis
MCANHDSSPVMIDAPLVSGLDNETLDAARRRAASAGETLIYIHVETGSGSPAGDLRKLARYFSITGIRAVERGLGVVGVARPSVNEVVTEHEIAQLLDQAVRAERDARHRALQQLREVERGLRRRSLELLEADRRIIDAKADKEAMDRKLRLAQLQTEKVKGMLSFRLGHTLIHKTKSARGVLELPRALWELQQQKRARTRETPLDRIVRRISRLREPAGGVARPSQIVPAPHYQPPFAIGTGAELKRLRVAGIFDEFSAHAFAPECELIALHAETWQAQLAAHPPHLLFIESAWHGAGGSWARKIAQPTGPLRELVEHCRAAGTPTAFWNKEDPVHFGTFLHTAALFDAVFTTDFDCLHRYRDALGHDRVYVLPFACQPRHHNPIERFERKAAACFAGAYYTRYPERQRDFLRILIKLLELGPVEIFDRNHGKDDADYQFPASYRDYIVGNLPFSEIDRAYKGYRYAININSIKTSQTMFARRVFELLASNTLTVSNYAKGIRLLFGDLVIAGDDAASLASRLAQLEHDEVAARALRRAALRKVLAEHTYQDRFAYVVTKLFENVAPPRLTPNITVVGSAAIAGAFARQRYAHKHLVTVTAQTSGQPAAELVEDGDFIAVFADGGDYGEHYLDDLALATRYYDGPVIGAATGVPYRTGQTVHRTAAIIRRDRLGTLTLGELLRPATIDDALAIDLGGEDRIDTGVPFATVLDHAGKVEVAAADDRGLDPTDLARLFAAGKHDALRIAHGADGLTIESSLVGEDRQFLYQQGELSIAELGFDTQARFQLVVTAGLRISVALMFFDQARKLLGQETRSAATTHELELPAGTIHVRVGLLVVGAGTAIVRRLAVGHVTSDEPTRIIGRSKVLLITNGYPASNALYRNAFVHRRVLDYRRAGVDVDVFCHRPEPLSYHEFEGIDVVSGRPEILRRMLASNHYETVLVHFLDDKIWRELAPRLDALRVFVWIHGAEIHPWHRRSYNHTTLEEIESAKSSSKPRTELWNTVLHPLHHNVHVITVSRTFAGEIEQDYALALPAAQHTVIHNVIDTELFRYEPKPAAQRTKILSIRPFASRQYANDLSVQAILELSTRPWFAELDIHIIGDGPLFDDTVAPLRNLPNVLVERRFARQDEIAALHRSHGIFLCPTRWDSQGVSRDEAMASGLVPITTRIAAVPEFVDEECGFLAPPEDATALAAAIEALYQDPVRFQRMSERAAARVRSDRSSTQTTARELALFTRRS